MERYKIVAAVLLLSASFFQAQTPQERYAAFRKQAQQQYDGFRNRANQQYADFIRKAWQSYHVNAPIPVPYEEPTPPVVIPEEERLKKRKDEAKPFEDIVVIEPPKPQPLPIEPIKPVEPVKPIEPVEPISPKQEHIMTTFYGTEIQCTIPLWPQYELTGLNEDNIADAWEQLSNGQCDSLLAQCLELRSRHRLCDWGYILLLDSISKNIAKHSTTANDSKTTLLMAWLYCQSGYMMRLARTEKRLYLLYASEGIIYDTYGILMDDNLFYAYSGEDLETLYLCNFTFPNERAMTLQLKVEPLLANRASSPRTLQSKRYPDIRIETNVNRNLIDFYNDYPTGTIDNDFGTRWAIYANTPLSDEARRTLYPQLRQRLDGKNKLQATEELLNFVQTSLVYAYDDSVWGDDRAFFAEESLFYPYSDCEDHSILFSRLVRDLLGLRVVLLYYPGHLATAVRFENEQPKGDYLQLNDGRYYIADPTYIGAPIGESMPSLRNEKIKVIVLH